jgi:hypothetical protein
MYFKFKVHFLSIHSSKFRVNIDTNPSEKIHTENTFKNKHLKKPKYTRFRLELMRRLLARKLF